MSYNTVLIPTQSDPNYSFRVDLEGGLFNMRIYWNDRTTSWHFDLSNGDTDIVTNKRIVNNYPLMENFDMSEWGLSGFFTCVSYAKEDPQTLNKEYDALNEQYLLYYIY